MAFDAKYCPDAIYNPTRSVLLNDENYLYRLREHPEKDDPDYVSVLRDPDGAHDACELSDTFYFTPGQGTQPRSAGYHEHRKGFGLFMVGGEGAKCLIRVRGRRRGRTWGTRCSCRRRRRIPSSGTATRCAGARCSPACA